MLSNCASRVRLQYSLYMELLSLRTLPFLVNLKLAVIGISIHNVCTCCGSLRILVNPPRVLLPCDIYYIDLRVTNRLKHGNNICLRVR